MLGCGAVALPSTEKIVIAHTYIPGQYEVPYRQHITHAEEYYGSKKI